MPATALLFTLLGKDEASPAFLRASASMDKTTASADRATGSVLGFSKKAKAGLGALLTVDVAAHMVKQASSFQKSMLTIKTQAGASTGEVNRMSTAVLSLAGKTATAPQTLALSMYHVESAGLRGAAAIGAVKIAAEGAKVGNADLEGTTNALTSALVSGIKGVSNMSQAMGALNATVGAGDMRMQDLNEALGSGILKVAKTFGLSLTDVGAALADFGDNNIRGANAATMLRVAITSMAKPVAGGAAALDKIGLSSHSLADDMRKGGLLTAVSDLKTHLTAAGITGDKVGSVLLNAFGKKAGPGVTILVDDLDRLRSKTDVINQGAKGFGAAWKATTKNASFAFDQLKSDLDVISIQVGTKLIPPVTSFAHFMTGTLGPALSTPFHDLLSTFGAIGSGVSKLSGLMGGLHVPLAGIAVAGLAAWGTLKLISGVGTLFTLGAVKVLEMRDSLIGFGVAAKASALSFATSAGAISTTADTTAVSVAASGDTARIGWAGLLGPVGAAAVGIGLLVSLFHKSSAASKEATGATKAYTDALNSGGGNASIIDTITTQLAKNNIPATLAKYNKSLGQNASAWKVSGKEMVTAINHGGPALTNLQKKIAEVAITGSNNSPAYKLLTSLTAEYDGLTKAAKKELANYKELGMVAAPISKVASSLKLSSDSAVQYAGMLGLAVTSQNNLVDSSKANIAAIGNMAQAYNTATAAGSDFLDALNTFSKSAGVATDRASIIGATLKLANGDALGFAGAINGAAAANSQFSSDLKTNAMTLAGVTKDSKKVNLDYLGSIVNLKKGTIDYSKAGAAPLIADMQSMQTAALAAAQAQYQHARATMLGKDAADQAYKVYTSMTKGALTDQLTKLTGNAGAAKKLADQYFGMPKQVKTLIEQEGADPVLTVLNKIGVLLAKFTGQDWNVKVPTGGIDAAITRAQTLIDKLRSAGSAASGAQLANATAGGKGGVQKARGGTIFGSGSGDTVPAMLTPGEEVISKGPATKHRRLLKAINAGVQGFATGGTVNGVKYTSDLAYQNAKTRAAKADQSTLKGNVSTSIGNVGSSPTPRFSVADTGIARIRAQIKAATTTLNDQIGKGLSKSAAAGFRKQIASLTALANKQLGALRVKIKGSDLTAIKNGLKGTVDDTRAAITQMLTDMSRSGASSGALALASSLGSRLVNSQNTLASAKDYRSGISSTLSGAFDPSQFGSVADLKTGLAGATSKNKGYTSNVNKLLASAKGNKTLTAFINQLDAQGDSATLQSLAGDSKADLNGSVTKDIAAYNSSVAGGADAATTGEYGKSIATMAKNQADLTSAIGELAQAFAAVSKRPINLNGKQIAEASDASIEAAVARLTRLVSHGRK